MSRRASVETGTRGSLSGSESSEQSPLLGPAPSSDSREHSPTSSPEPWLLGTLASQYTKMLWRILDCCRVGNVFRRRFDRWRKEDELNIYSVPSLAILMSYFSVGVALELLATPVAYYLIDDLGAESGVYTVWIILTTLPWSFKVGYGFLSDCVPIQGLKRKPYMLIGWTIHIVCNATLAIMGTPGQVWTVLLSFLSACGYLLSDVMTDTMVVEKTQKESMHNMGNIQASGYIARYFGSALGAFGGAVLYNKNTWGWGLSISTLFWINGLVPLFLVMPLVPFLIEEAKPKEVGVLKRRTAEIWNLVQKKAVWRPIIFVYLYNALMIPNASWTNYLVETLDFSDWYIGVVNIASQVFAWLGLIIYKKWMTDVTWPTLYFITTFISFVFSILQLLLILGISTAWGVPDLLFASGDQAASEVVLSFQFLPLTRMYAVMCPVGSEGTSYALLTTVSNVAYSVAYAIGDLLTNLGGNWSTSNSTLSEGDMSGMWRLTVLTSCIAVTPIFLVWLLPQSKEEQLKLQKSSDSNALAGKLFLWIVGLSIGFTLLEAVWELIYDT